MEYFFNTQGKKGFMICLKGKRFQQGLMSQYAVLTDKATKKRDCCMTAREIPFSYISGHVMKSILHQKVYKTKGKTMMLKRRLMLDIFSFGNFHLMKIILQ